MGKQDLRSFFSFIGNFIKGIGRSILNFFKGDSYKVKAAGIENSVFKSDVTTNKSIDFFTPKYQTASKEKNKKSEENQSNQNDNSKDKENNSEDKVKDDNSSSNNGNDSGEGNNGLHLGWCKRADHPKNPANTGDLNNPTAYEIINYINDVSLNNAEVLMTSDREGIWIT